MSLYDINIDLHYRGEINDLDLLKHDLKVQIEKSILNKNKIENLVITIDPIAVELDAKDSEE